MSVKPQTIFRPLFKLYNMSLAGTKGLDSAFELAAKYRQKPGTLEHKIDMLIRWQSARCATSGFVSGLGGLATLPISLPFDATANYFVQIRMVATIALLCGYDIRSDKIKDFVFACLLGNAVKDVLKDAGVALAKKKTSHALTKISSESMKRVHKKVGKKLLMKLGRKGVVHKLVPVIGGVVGGSLDMIACQSVGQIAKKLFLEN